MTLFVTSEDSVIDPRLTFCKDDRIFSTYALFFFLCEADIFNILSQFLRIVKSIDCGGIFYPCRAARHCASYDAEFCNICANGTFIYLFRMFNILFRYIAPAFALVRRRNGAKKRTLPRPPFHLLLITSSTGARNASSRSA